MTRSPNDPPLPPVLFEDASLLVLDKPPGMLVHSVGNPEDRALVDIARRARPDSEVNLAHRLDRDTSGVLVLTLDPTADRHLKKMFARRKVEKRYLALTVGLPTWDTCVCTTTLGHSAGTEVTLRQRPDPNGPAAETAFWVLRRLKQHALVRCDPRTGRTHQIRAHLACLGLPVLGDKLYGQADATFLEHLRKGATAHVRACVGFPRHALHAASITFPHPATGRVLHLEAPLPPDMEGIVAGGAPRWLDGDALGE